MGAIKRCDCEHEYQDEKYGKWMRVMNEIVKKQGISTQYRCTVCEKIRS